MRDMHRVVVTERDVESYIARGYALSAVSPAAHVGDAWRLLPEEEQDKLRLVEIDAVAHARLQQPERAFAVQLMHDYLPMSAHVRTFDVLEREQRWSHVANVTKDYPERMETERLRPTAREALQHSKGFVEAAIRRLREHADALETWLRDGLA